VSPPSLVIPDLAERARRGDFAFEPYFPGVEIHRIYGDDSQGPSAVLLRYEPGARVPRHSHAGYEHVYILVGEQTDERGSYGTGTLVVNPPHSRHDEVHSATGCVVLVIRERPVVFVDRAGG
jgi:anti-sigma factor ChrR (cupin superfamily)